MNHVERGQGSEGTTPAAEQRPALRYGYSQGIPAGVTAAWGARAIVNTDGTVDLVHDRQDAYGDSTAVVALLERLNAGINAAWIAKARDLLRSGEMSTRQAEQFVLYRDAQVSVLGNTNASAGYLYVVAYPTTDK